MKKILLLLSCLWLCLIGTSQTTARYAEEDPLLLVLQKEMNEQFLIYAQKSTPILRMWFDVQERATHELNVYFGTLGKDQISTTSRSLEITMVVGNEDINNYHSLNVIPHTRTLPLTNDPEVLHHIIAQQVKEIYEEELAHCIDAEVRNTLQSEHSTDEVPMLVDTFHYEPYANTTYNREGLIQKMSDCTHDYLQTQEVTNCLMDMSYVIKRTYRIDNAGSLIVSNENEAQFTLSMSNVNGSKKSAFYEVESPNDLPPIDILRKDAAGLYSELLNANPHSSNLYHRIRPYDAEMEGFSTDTPDGLFRALQDEIDANLDALRIHESYPPYYISYLVSDAEIVRLESALGYPQESSEKHVRNVFPTVSIGMDLLNNEHYKTDTKRTYSLPLNNDYNTLRSALWAATHNTYVKSVGDFIGKQKYLQQHHVDESKLPADRSVEKTQNVIQHKHYEPLNIAEIQNHLDDISSIFLKDSVFKKNIGNASATFESYRGNAYFLASDGVQYAQPIAIVCIDLQMETKAPNVLYDHQRFVFAEVNEEMVWDSLLTAAKRIGSTLIERSTAARVAEAYDGPVLFLAQAASEAFALGCTESAQTLLNRRPGMVTDEHTSTLDGWSFEPFLNQQITSSIFDIYACDQQEQFNGHTLIGAYAIDADGVPVDKKTQLVHRGEMISMLTNREATPNFPNSNGHQRFWISGLNNHSVHTASGAGVLTLASHSKMSYDKLEKELRKQAREAGYRYAYIIERITGDPWHEVECIAYRIDVRTGKKAPVETAFLHHPTLWQFRNATATSDKDTFLNTIIYNEFGYSRSYMPISVITPTAILFKTWHMEVF